jgi:hypothetical protein
MTRLAKRAARFLPSVFRLLAPGFWLLASCLAQDAPHRLVERAAGDTPLISDLMKEGVFYRNDATR